MTGVQTCALPICMELVGFDDEDNSGKKKEAYIETIKPNKGGKKNIVKKE